MTRKPRSKSDISPKVGIIFLVGDKLLIDATPVFKAETYGDFRIHERGHDTYWEMLKQAGEVPDGSEYEDHPRGRVAYNTNTGEYLLFLDRCILKKKSAVSTNMLELNLPTNSTKTDTDSHYRCPNCLRKRHRRVGDPW